MINSPSLIIERLGGPRAIAIRIGLPVTTVASWASRNSIPVKAWPEIVTVAKENGLRGVNYNFLAEAHIEGSAA